MRAGRQRLLAAALPVAALLILGPGCASLGGGTRDEVVKFEKEAVARVTSIPAGADVLLDDTWLGVTPLDVPLAYELTITRTYKDFGPVGYILDALWLPFFPVGTALGLAFLVYDGSEDGELVEVRRVARIRRHKLRIHKDGYVEVERTLKVPRETKLHVRLEESGLPDKLTGAAPAPPAAAPRPTNPAGPTAEPRMGILEVGSDPPGLRVRVEGVGTGYVLTMNAETPVTAAVIAGRYRVTIDDPRFWPQTAELEVPLGERVHLKLAPRARPPAEPEPAIDALEDAPPPPPRAPKPRTPGSR